MRAIHLVLVVLLGAGGMAGWWMYWNVPGPRVVAVGGTDVQQAELSAAIAMFRHAGLEVPAVAFRFSQEEADCGRYGRGRAHEKWPRHVVWVCNERRLTILHELAHVWTYDVLDEEERRIWSRHGGYPGWRGHNLEWTEKGSERAAEVVMWRVLAGEWVPRSGSADQASLTAEWDWMTAAADPGSVPSS